MTSAPVKPTAMPATPSGVVRRRRSIAEKASVRMGESVNRIEVKPAPSRGMTEKTRAFGIASEITPATRS
jgi:hypothetical protein